MALLSKRTGTIDSIVFKLTQPQRKFLNNWIDTLIEANSTLGKSQVLFSLQGTQYTHSLYLGATVKNPTHSSYRLDLSLHDEGHELASAINKLNKDVRQISQGIGMLSSFCITTQDFRDALPEACAKLHAPYAALPRQNKEAWVLEDKPLRLEDWKRTRDLITVHLSNRMLT